MVINSISKLSISDISKNLVMKDTNYSRGDINFAIYRPRPESEHNAECTDLFTQPRYFHIDGVMMIDESLLEFSLVLDITEIAKYDDLYPLVEHKDESIKVFSSDIKDLHLKTLVSNLIRDSWERMKKSKDGYKKIPEPTTESTII